MLDPLFIYTLGMGIRGAGAATALSQVMVWAALLWFYVRGKTSVRISVRQVARTPQMVKLIFTTGFPSLCRHCGNALATIVLNRAAGGFGDAAIAAFSIASRVSGLALSVSIGFVQGLQPVAGYAHGSKDHARLKSAFRFCCAASMSALTALAVIIAAAAPWIVRMLSPSDGGLVETGAAVLRATSIALPFTTFINCTGTLFQAIRESARSSALVLGKQVCIYIPLLLALPRAWSMNGLMAAMPLADALGFLAALWMARSYFRRAQHAAAL
ncbi:MAG: MATE family efflux transporter [Ruthenibacterium lactatiformans]